MDMQAVENLYNHYHEKIKTHPTLYAPGEDCVTVVLPEELIEYANAAAGHSNYRPIGIRRSCSNSKEEIASIFYSVQSLANFISSSECNAIQHIVHLKEKAAKKTQKEQIARTVFWKKYDKSIMDQLKSKYKINDLREALDTLTMDEFEKKFNLVK